MKSVLGRTLRALSMAGALAGGMVGPAAAGTWSDRFVDEQDGAFDASDHLLEYRGALPVPIVITEPAIGYGAGAALIDFRESMASAREKGRSRGDRMAIPDIGAVAAFKTSTGSQGVGRLLRHAGQRPLPLPRRRRQGRTPSRLLRAPGSTAALRPRCAAVRGAGPRAHP